MGYGFTILLNGTVVLYNAARHHFIQVNVIILSNGTIILFKCYHQLRSKWVYLHCLSGFIEKQHDGVKSSFYIVVTRRAEFAWLIYGIIAVPS
jgi:hypothetical protein